MGEKEIRPEENLDPEDWDRLRALGHQMIDDMIDYLSTVRERAVWQPIPGEVKEALQTAAPREPQGEEAAYEEFKELILPHPMGNIHPRFWGWVMGNGIPYAVLADMMAAAMNPNMGGGDHVPNYVERQVIDWCKEMVGFPKDASGILVSGGSMANLVGLAVARNAAAGFDVRAEGVSTAAERMIVYASSETHSSNIKAIELLGLGRAGFGEIPVNEAYQIDLTALRKRIEADKKAGFKSICLIGNAGTVNTGAIDDLTALADICEKEGMWFHVDGAFGALAALPESLRGLVKGMERADSLAFDLHKWMYMPFEAACVLIRDIEDHAGAFSVSPDYLSHMPRGAAGGHHAWFGELGVQLTRGFRALKIWMTIKAYGLDKFSRLIEQNVHQAQYLTSKVEAAGELELLAAAPLNIVCFRFKPPGMQDEEDLNTLNREIMMQLHERGLAVPSYTRLNGKFALRAAITNHRSRLEDFDFLVERVIEIGNVITGGG